MKSDTVGRMITISYTGEEFVDLFGDIQFRVNNLSMAKREVELEKLIIR